MPKLLNALLTFAAVAANLPKTDAVSGLEGKVVFHVPEGTTGYPPLGTEIDAICGGKEKTVCLTSPVRIEASETPVFWYNEERQYLTGAETPVTWSQKVGFGATFFGGDAFAYDHNVSCVYTDGAKYPVRLNYLLMNVGKASGWEDGVPKHLYVSGAKMITCLLDGPNYSEEAVAPAEEAVHVVEEVKALGDAVTVVTDTVE